MPRIMVGTRDTRGMACFSSISSNEFSPPSWLETESKPRIQRIHCYGKIWQAQPKKAIYTPSQYQWYMAVWNTLAFIFSSKLVTYWSLITGGGLKHCVTMPKSARHARFHGPDKKKNNKHFDTLRSSSENWNLSAQSVEKQTINVAVLPLRKNTQ